jgi:hypothetical protein
MFPITPRVRFLQLLQVVNNLPLLVAADTSGTPPLDLSKAVKLKELLFRCGKLNLPRITMALQTVQSKNLQQITINPYGTFVNPIGATDPQEWQDLDRLLVQFWTSHSIRPKIVYQAGKGLNDLVPSLLPELMGRGAVYLVEDNCVVPFNVAWG